MGHLLATSAFRMISMRRMIFAVDMSSPILSFPALTWA
jgi:hypothetical protein